MTPAAFMLPINIMVPCQYLMYRRLITSLLNHFVPFGVPGRVHPWMRALFKLLWIQYLAQGYVSGGTLFPAMFVCSGA